MTTNVPQISWSPGGPVAPSEAAILAGVQLDINAAFGGNLNFTSETTPQGQLAASFAAVIADSYDQIVLQSNNSDPAFASGRSQDALGRLYLMTRIPASSTVVTCTVTGAGVTIPEGALAVDQAGNLYAALDHVTLPPGGGTASLEFANVQTGPIPCAPNSLTQIYRGLPGWDAITNADAGVAGTNAETQQAFEYRREQSVAGNSMGPLGGMIAAVAAVPGVLDYFGYDNFTGSPVTVGGVTVAANSVYIAVYGGTDLAVAQAILSKKPPGCGMSGNDTVTAYDDNPLYSAPIPYSITFERPSAQAVVVVVTVVANAQTPSDFVSLVQAAVMNAFTGADGGPRARIAAPLYASRFYAGIAAAWPGAEIVSVLLGAGASAAATSSSTSISGTTMTVGGTITGTFAVGQLVSDGGVDVQPGTVITGLGSGSGGAGTYVVNISQTVAAEAVSTYAAASNSLSLNYNIEPTLSDVTIGAVSQ